MTVHTANTAITAEELYAMGDIGRCELVRGEIIMMAPGGGEHGHVTFDICWFIGSFVREHDLGAIYAAETGFIIARNPDTVRAPDVAFIRKTRVPDIYERGYLPLVPDLVVEVISFNDRKSEVVKKIAAWLDAGVQSAWVIDPPRRSITVHRAQINPIVYRGDEVIADEPLLPGFTLKPSQIFRPR